MNKNFLVDNVRLVLRPVEARDDEFVYRVYASTRADEMALVNWTAEQQEAFLRMQVSAQTDHYKIHYPQAKYHIIEREDVPIGRLITERSKDDILIIDIALLPEYRNMGIGTAILTDLMHAATGESRQIVLRVEFFNPALHLYARLGFVKTREMSIYHEMVWTPGDHNQGTEN